MSILAVMEQRAGAWNRVSFETLAAARQFARELDTTASAAVLGHSIGHLAAELASKPLAKVYAVEHALLQDYTADAYTIALRQLVELAKPSIVLFPQTYQVRDFLPKLAASLGKVAVSDAISHRVENGQLVLARQLFQGKVNVDSPEGMYKTSLDWHKSGAFANIGADYMSTRYFTYSNDGSVAGRFLAEIGAGYKRAELGAFKDLKAQINATNLLNSQYWASIGTNGFIYSDPLSINNNTLQVGAPRTVSGTLSVSF